MIGWHYVTQFYWRILVMGEYYIRKRKEMSYIKKTFLHLTGVNTRLSATTFFQEAINGTLQENQIFLIKDFR